MGPAAASSGAAWLSQQPRHRLAAAAAIFAAADPPDDPASAFSISDAGPTSGSERPPTADMDLWIVWSLCCLVERGWKFGFALVAGMLEGGFRTMALCGLGSHVSAVVLGPALGSALDVAMRNPTGTPQGRVASLMRRERVLATVLLVQNVTAAATALLILAAICVAAENGVATAPLALPGVVPTLVLLQVAQRIANALSDVCVERGWVVEANDAAGGAGVEGGGALGLLQANSRVRLVDQASDLVSTALLGLVASRSGLRGILVFSAVLAVAAIPVQTIAVASLGRRVRVGVRGTTAPPPPPPPSPQASSRDPDGWTAPARASPAPVRSALVGIVRGFAACAASSGWTRALDTYRRQPSFLPSFAIGVLFFNVALSPSTVLTTWLVSSGGATGAEAAAFRTACALGGSVGIWLGTRIIARVGVAYAGLGAVLGQSALCTAAAVCYLAWLTGAWPGVVAGPGTGLPPALATMAVLVAVSRLGLWTYDLVVAQARR